jgi:hypothetical protein
MFVSTPPLKTCWTVHTTRLFVSKVPTRHGRAFWTRFVHVCGLGMGSLPLKTPFFQSHDIFVRTLPLKTGWTVHTTRLFVSKVQTRHGRAFWTRFVHVCGLGMDSLPLKTPLFPGTFFFREYPTPENVLDCPHHSAFRFKSSNSFWMGFLDSLCACLWPGHGFFAAQNPTFPSHMIFS